MTGVDAKLVRHWTGRRHLLEDPLPDTALRPPVVAVVDRRRRSIAGGTSRQRHPVFSTCRMPEMTIRSSTRGFPGLPCGRWGSIVAHASSDNQNKLLAMPSASSDSNHGKNISWNQRSVWVLTLGHNPKKFASTFSICQHRIYPMSHEDMLQLIDIEQFLFDHVIPRDQEALSLIRPRRSGWL